MMVRTLLLCSLVKILGLIHAGRIEPNEYSTLQRSRLAVAAERCGIDGRDKSHPPHLLDKLDRSNANMMRVDQELLSIGHADLVENARHVMPNRAVTN